MPRKVAVKGDEYKIEGDKYQATVDDPAKKVPPGYPYPEPPYPFNPPVYPEPPTREVADIQVEDDEDDGSEFVFWEEHPVILAGYKFSTLSREVFVRTWETDAEGHAIIKKYSDESQGTTELGITATEGSDFVFADGYPLSRLDDTVEAKGGKVVYNNGEKSVSDEEQAEGKITSCQSNVFVD